MEFLELEVVCLSNYLWLCVDKFSSFHLSFIFLKILVYTCKFLVEVVHSSDYLCICDCIYTGWLLCPPCSGGHWHLPGDQSSHCPTEQCQFHHCLWERLVLFSILCNMHFCAKGFFYVLCPPLCCSTCVSCSPLCCSTSVSCSTNHALHGCSF